jgi:hypothetical protein
LWAVWVTVGDHLSGGDVQGAEQVRDAVPLAVVGTFVRHAFVRQSEVDRQRRLCAIRAWSPRRGTALPPRGVDTGIAEYRPWWIRGRGHVAGLVVSVIALPPPRSHPSRYPGSPPTQRSTVGTGTPGQLGPHPEVSGPSAIHNTIRARVAITADTSATVDHRGEAPSLFLRLHPISSGIGRHKSDRLT